MENVVKVTEETRVQRELNLLLEMTLKMEHELSVALLSEE